jgi:DNA-directed RNA polymerase specialized sigma24 family protein
VVRRAGEDEEGVARTALEVLCLAYWYPIYGFIRRQGHAHHQAEDLAQSFFALLIANERIGQARPDRGRFRTFLLTALRHFLINQWHRGRAAKRGAGQIPLPIDFAAADTAFHRELTDRALTPEQAFDRTWALGVIELSLEDLRIEYTAHGRGRLFTVLAPLVWGGGPTGPLLPEARRLGLEEGALRVALHRLRRRLRERLIVRVTATIADGASEAEVADELRFLIATVSTPSVSP